MCVAVCVASVGASRSILTACDRVKSIREADLISYKSFTWWTRASEDRQQITFIGIAVIASARVAAPHLLTTPIFHHCVTTASPLGPAAVTRHWPKHRLQPETLRLRTPTVTKCLIAYVYSCTDLRRASPVINVVLMMDPEDSTTLDAAGG